MSSSTNVFQNPDMQLGNYSADQQKLLQDAWQKLLNQPENANKNLGTEQKYANGGMSLQDALKGAVGGANGVNDIFTSPISGGKAAAEQVQSNPLFASMFGQGGTQDQRQGAEADLMKRGFSLKPEDYEAYGQASDNIARQFGQTENSLSQALASHGLATGPSGAAGAAYSGIMGNKNEQLAQSQRQIANDRMQMNLQRLSSMQQAVNGGNQLAQGAWNSQKSSNEQGNEDLQNKLKGAYGVTQDFNGENNTQFTQDQSTKFNPGALVGGVLGGAVSSGLGSLAGGLGTGLAGSVWGGNKSATDAINAGKKV